MSRMRSPWNGSDAARRRGGVARDRSMRRRRIEGTVPETRGRVPAAEAARRSFERGLRIRPHRPGDWSRRSRVHGSAAYVVTLEPLAIGALGIRKADARSSTSSTV